MASFTKMLILRVSTALAILCLMLICVVFVWWPFPVDKSNFDSANAQLNTMCALIYFGIGALVVCGLAQPGPQDKESVARFVKAHFESGSLNSLLRSLIKESDRKFRNKD